MDTSANSLLDTPQDENKAESNKVLIKYLSQLKDVATKAKKTSQFHTFENYYLGKYDDNATNLKNACNIIKPIIDAKATFILDSELTTVVEPAIISHADFDKVQEMETIADILEDCKNNVFKQNKIQYIKEQVIERALKTNTGIIKRYWDQDASDGLGDIVLKEVNPRFIHCEPTAKDISSANYIIEEITLSLIQAKKTYPEFADELDKICNSLEDKFDGEKNGRTENVVTVTANNQVEQKYSPSQPGYQNADKLITIYEAQILDESVFSPGQDSTDKEDLEIETMKTALKYPDGRCIVYAGKDLILDDKPRKNPYRQFNETPGDEVYPKGGTVEQLTFIQDRINRAYIRVQQLIATNMNAIVFDEGCGLNTNDFINQGVLKLANGTLQTMMPQVLQNNTTSGVSALMSYIDSLKTNAKELARINDMMLSGEKSRGVNSGTMVESLNESAMVGIRQIQNNFAQFMIDLTQDVVELIQQHYTMERIVKLSTGYYVKLPLKQNDQPNVIQIIDKIGNVVNTINADLSVGKYMINITAGTKNPQPRSVLANTMMTLAQQGRLGNPNSADVSEIILDYLDIPNRHEIIDRLRQQEADQSKSPPPASSFIDKMSFGFKDLQMFPYAQQQVLQQLGLNPDSPALNALQPVINQVNAENQAQSPQQPIPSPAVPTGSLGAPPLKPPPNLQPTGQPS